MNRGFHALAYLLSSAMLAVCSLPPTALAVTPDFTGRTDAILSWEAIDTGLDYNHPSSIVELKNGDLVIAWAGGLNEGESTAIRVMRKVNGIWQPMQTVTPVASMFDPVLFEPSANGAPLLLTYYKGCCHDQYVRQSFDNGATWSAEQKMYPAAGVSGYNQDFMEAAEQNPPLELPGGDLLASHDRWQDGASTSNWVTRIPSDNLLGDAGGTPWQLTALDDAGVNGSELFGNGSFLVFDTGYQHLGLIVRRAIHGHPWFLESFDGGLTWSDAVMPSISLLEGSGPRAGISALSLDIDGGAAQGWHLFAGAGGACGLCRDFVVIAASQDGRNWDARLQVAIGDGEQADPTLIQTADRNVHMLFTGRDSEPVRHMVIDPDVLLDIAPGGNNPPVALVQANPTAGDVPLPVSFDASGSSDPDGDPLTFDWNFGDGATASGASPNHTYNSAGTYTATVIVSDGNGGSDSASLTISATDPGGNNPPLAVLQANPTAGDVPLPVSFDASGSSDPDGDPLTFDWNFGDGATASGASPNHTYDSAGTYTATVTVSDGNGGSDSASVAILVNNPGGGNLVAYEGFAYPPGSGVDGSGGGDGWSGAWTGTGDGGDPSSIVTGLEMGSGAWALQTTGNAVFVDGDALNADEEIERALASPVDSGTLWYSYLCWNPELDSHGTNDVRSYVGGGSYFTKPQFDASLSLYYGNNPAATAHDSGPGGLIETVYLDVVRFTGVGTAGGQATGWRLDQAAFDTVAGDGVIEVAELDAHAIATASFTNTSGTAPPLASFVVHNHDNKDNKIVIDEIRIGLGATLAEAAVLPLVANQDPDLLFVDGFEN